MGSPASPIDTSERNKFIESRISVKVGNDVVLAEPDNTTKENLEAYKAQMEIIARIFNDLSKGTSSTPESSRQLGDAIEGLRTLARDGKLSLSMCKTLDTMLTIKNNIGSTFDANSFFNILKNNPDVITFLTPEVKDGVTTTVADRIDSANMSLAERLMDFIGVGNKLVAGKLAGLKNTLDIGEKVSDALRQLEDAFTERSPPKEGDIDPKTGVKFTSLDILIKNGDKRVVNSAQNLAAYTRYLSEGNSMSTALALTVLHDATFVKLGEYAFQPMGPNTPRMDDITRRDMYYGIFGKDTFQSELDSDKTKGDVFNFERLTDGQKANAITWVKENLFRTNPSRVYFGSPTLESAYRNYASKYDQDTSIALTILRDTNFKEAGTIGNTPLGIGTTIIGYAEKTSFFKAVYPEKTDGQISDIKALPFNYDDLTVTQAAAARKWIQDNLMWKVDMSKDGVPYDVTSSVPAIVKDNPDRDTKVATTIRNMVKNAYDRLEQPKAEDYSGSLKEKLKNLLEPPGGPNVIPSDPKLVKAWLADASGENQRAIAYAVSTATSFNDKNKQEISAQMSQFQTWCQMCFAAIAMLQQMASRVLSGIKG